ncbi:MAG: hypothetical protein FJ190_00250 [Gammaproteobacteria bacterium]|nr:hypothetical protein [Gammaproteobacteria bacterium]
MQRRNFIKWSAASIGASLFLPEWVAAKDVVATSVSDIYYTKESPGRWKDKVAGHLPSIGIEKSKGKITVKVATAHEMKGYEHYIVKHVLLDKNYKFIDEHLFNPEKDKAAVSTFALDQCSGVIFVLSMCNKHDLWLNSATV